MYGKVFTKTYVGSMVGAGPVVFALWPYVIAHKDVDQFVDLNETILAVTFGCSVEEVEKAIRYLSSPDTRSRSKEEEGRRILPTGKEFQFFVVNGAYYDGIRTAEERRTYQRKYWQDHRSKSAQAPSTPLNTTQHHSTRSTPVAVSVTTDKASTSTPPRKTISAPRKAAPKKPGARVIDYSPVFEEAWLVLRPLRPDQSKADAWKAWSARLREGCTQEVMYGGAKAYADHCRREGKEPRYIKHAATFFGPGRHFESSYETVAHEPTEDDILRNASSEQRRRIARIEQIIAEDAAEEARSAR